VTVTAPAGEPPGGEREPEPAQIAAARGMAPRELKRRLSGDLDAIILKAMRKDPRGRYASAEEMAADVERHLRGIPVRARNYSPAYRAAHWTGRHAPAAALAAVLLAGGAGIVYWRATRPPSRGILGGAPPANREAARLYTAGVEKLRDFDTTAAQDLFEQSLRADPNHALTHAMLALTFRSLGESGRARTAAARAVELSKNLPREDQLYAEGLSAEATSDWSRALEVYSALHAVFPDIEYGLRLASAQIRSGRPDQGIATLERIRNQSSAADPRIDVELAEAASMTGDAERQLRAASRAAQAGAERRSNILVARARLLEGTALAALKQPARAIRALEEARRIYAGARHFRGIALADEALEKTRPAAGR
jgi:tetratricopeptide (TPR) repeat protein